MNKLKTLSVTLFFISVILFTSCKKDAETIVPDKYTNGVFITNEGPYGDGSGTITFIGRDSNQVRKNIFETVNGRPLGNIVQSMAIFRQKGYIVVNNAGRVEVVDVESFKSIASVNAFTQPRYFLPVNDTTAYVSDWAGDVKVMNLKTNTVTGSIPAGTGPELMIKKDNQVFVLNGGGFSVDSTITVINTLSGTVADTLQVFDRPTGIVEDIDGKIWVMCSGRGNNWAPDPADTRAHLICINPVSFEIEKDIPFNTTSMHPEKLVINASKTILYFLYDGGIYQYKFGVAGSRMNKLIIRGNLYSLGIDPATNYLYAADPIDYQQDGWVFRYNADSGVQVDSIRAGVIPGGYCPN